MTRLINLVGLLALLLAPSALAGELARLFSAVNSGVVEILATQAGPLTRQDSQLLPERGLGSGFLISREGLVMTAAHVVQVADIVYIRYLNGEAIGVVSLIVSRTGGYEGLGFAVTSNTARRLLLEERAVWTGVDAVVISGDTARILDVPQAAGLLIQRVAAGLGMPSGAHRRAPGCA